MARAFMSPIGHRENHPCPAPRDVQNVMARDEAHRVLCATKEGWAEDERGLWVIHYNDRYKVWAGDSLNPALDQTVLAVLAESIGAILPELDRLESEAREGAR